ncbi:alcohol dehydrogenase catalytic domain-containing protein [Frankia sp. CNm7]|uniref:Alcohol dehydrogenase catalytic domain-containing protein n=1 Tax=Frankia nepalensis TaxID=1836974 RepID=A0A937RC03_9ACTN|nr:alcohol dehydrogenase catalytic domain-containing protein [Frankia nepalensis]MBL7500829.1 alcohol dehydrogenase catalytic domain-containing protein [Frankia nepalensis]MBL7515310.1 alcohol dehydrogenase catalytic domain-containing protein [Frankia nepalensis]MBL7522277.1 alcohol dehydrogenase catalytic domain-containing protein [Frankia nepalensis]MBL7627042.1 alcohol dehydrogenase catalytic domain-containing protein [Frankia nepalensis]
MRQLVYDAPGSYTWHDAADPELAAPEQAIVRPVAVACCDLDVAVARSRAPLPAGYAQGHEGVAEVVAVGEAVTTVRPGERVIVPFQLSCGHCRECRRGVTGSCRSVPPQAMYGLGSIAGLDGGGFLADLVLVPYADAMLIPLPAFLDPVAVASLSDNIPDGWRTVGPYADELAALDEIDRRVLVTGGLSIGVYAAAFAAALGAHVDYIDTDPRRLGAAEKLGANPVDAKLPDPKAEPYPITVSTSANPASLDATLKATWPYGVCTDTGIYYGGALALPILKLYTNGIRFVTGRANARADIPQALDLLAAGLDLRPAVETVADWESAPRTWAALRGKTVITRG